MRGGLSSSLVSRLEQRNVLTRVPDTAVGLNFWKRRASAPHSGVPPVGGAANDAASCAGCVTPPTPGRFRNTTSQPAGVVDVTMSTTQAAIFSSSVHLVVDCRKPPEAPVIGSVTAVFMLPLSSSSNTCERGSQDQLQRENQSASDSRHVEKRKTARTCHPSRLLQRVRKPS